MSGRSLSYSSFVNTSAGKMSALYFRAEDPKRVNNTYPRYRSENVIRLYDTKVFVPQNFSLYNLPMRKDEHIFIPNWAASLAAFGVICAIIGFILAWFSNSGFATLLLTVGLAIAGIGFNAAERALKNANRE